MKFSVATLIFAFSALVAYAVPVDERMWNGQGAAGWKRTELDERMWNGQGAAGWKRADLERSWGPDSVEWKRTEVDERSWGPDSAEWKREEVERGLGLDTLERRRAESESA